MRKISFCIFLIFALQPLARANDFATEIWYTGNGAKVVFYPAKEVPMLDIRIAFGAGSAYDGQLYGLSALTMRCLDQGSATISAQQIAERLANVGAQYESESSRDMAVVHLKTLSEDKALASAVENFSLIINQPNFSNDTINRERNQQLVAINEVEESPDDVANQQFFTKLYQNHPYAHPINGAINSVRKINSAQVRAFYKRYFVGKNTLIVLVGAISSEQAHAIAEQVVGHLPSGDVAPAIPKALPLNEAIEDKINFPSTQTFIKIGQLGIEHSDPNFFPLMVGNYILGGGVLVSRLSNEVREKEGLTYSISSQFLPMPGIGPFLISLSTRNKETSRALQLTRETLASFLRNGPSSEELDAAKQYLIGSFPLTLASNSNIAGVLLRMHFYQLPPDYLATYRENINKVTVANIKKAFNATVSPEKMLTVQVGKL